MHAEMRSTFSHQIPSELRAVPRILCPILFAILVGQRRLFHKLASWLDHSRGRRLQDGAFMAMLLDSYVVEVGQPWWLTHQEIQEAAAAHPEQVQAKETDERVRQMVTCSDVFFFGT